MIKHISKNTIQHWEEVFSNIQDEVLDYYIDGVISKGEMENLVAWCEKMKQLKTREIKQGKKHK